MVILDTSFLFAYFYPQDNLHKKALEKEFFFDDEHCIIPLEVFQELITVITYKLSYRDAMKFGDALLAPESAIEIIKPDSAWITASYPTRSLSEP